MDTEAERLDIEGLYRAHADRLRRIAYLMTGRAAVAEELVHDAFLLVQPKLPGIEFPAAYLRTTVVRLCLTWRERDTWDRERAPRPATSVDPPELDETWQLLERLPRDQRVALVLRYYEDLSIDQIAQVTGSRAATVRTRIHRALIKLRKEMTP